MNFSTVIKGGVGSGNFSHIGRPGDIGGSGIGGADFTAAKESVKQILGNTKRLNLNVLDELSTDDLGKLSKAFSTMARMAPTPAERMSHSQTHRAVESALQAAEASPNRRVAGFRGAHKVQKFNPKHADQFREPNGRWADETEDRFNQPPEHATLRSGTGIGMIWF